LTSFCRKKKKKRRKLIENTLAALQLNRSTPDNDQQAAMQDSTTNSLPARRPGITTGFSQARSCHTTALSGCNQPHQAYSPLFSQMVPP